MPLQIVVDTNVLIAALRSKGGASFRLLTLIGESEKFEINLSVPLVLEYEDVANRQKSEIGLTASDIGSLLDYLCHVGHCRTIHFLWRPFLKDPKDDMVLEVAVEARCRYIVSFNAKDFAGVEQFGLRVLAPQDFLRKIGEIR